MQSSTPHQDDVAKLAELIRGIKIAMLTTVDSEGSLRSRPMATQDRPFDGELWFFTAKHSPKVDEIYADQQVNLSYAEPAHNRYVSVSGKGTLVDDRGTAKQLWTPDLKIWFPKGLDDPEVLLLKVVPTKAEYWDAPSSSLVLLAGFVQASVTGKSPHPGEHAKINL